MRTGRCKMARPHQHKSASIIRVRMRLVVGAALVAILAVIALLTLRPERKETVTIDIDSIIVDIAKVRVAEFDAAFETEDEVIIGELVAALRSAQWHAAEYSERGVPPRIADVLTVTLVHGDGAETEFRVAGEGAWILLDDAAALSWDVRNPDLERFWEEMWRRRHEARGS